jgi:hypothetical protein
MKKTFNVVSVVVLSESMWNVFDNTPAYVEDGYRVLTSYDPFFKLYRALARKGGMSIPRNVKRWNPSCLMFSEELESTLYKKFVKKYQKKYKHRLSTGEGIIWLEAAPSRYYEEHDYLYEGVRMERSKNSNVVYILDGFVVEVVDKKEIENERAKD